MAGGACKAKRGTRAGYQRHLRAKQKACADCLDGNAKYVASQRKK